jgi:hypothetical protein
MSSHSVVTPSDVFWFLVVALTLNFFAIRWLVGAWRELRRVIRYSRCAHTWRHTRREHLSFHASSSWPVRICDKCKTEERT